VKVREGELSVGGVGDGWRRAEKQAGVLEYWSGGVIEQVSECQREDDKSIPWRRTKRDAENWDSSLESPN
jgi:hypothetical protein